MSKRGLFGLTSSKEESKLIIMPVPWDVTASYGKGASLGPEAVLKASPQLDLYDYNYKDIYKMGIHMLPISEQIKINNERYSQNSENQKGAINVASQELEDEIYKITKHFLKEGKTLAVLGGDHSCPLGAHKAYLEHYEKDLSILHIDAHADLRNAYQGYEQSHASIMFNLLKLKPKSITQVGIRDFCESEFKLMESSDFLSTYLDATLKEQAYDGVTWKETCKDIINSLKSDHVYISFDIDGLSPEFCPNTGTPVPGGLSYNEAVYLIHQLSISDKKIVGFDLCEVAPDQNQENEWDGNVGARILYQLSCASLSNKELS